MTYRAEQLSRRERQIMDVVYRRGEATVADVLEDLPDPPTYTTVRTLLRILEEKGRLTHRKSANKFVYSPTVSPERAKRSAIRSLLDTYFHGSAEGAVHALIDMSAAKMTDEQLDRLLDEIQRAKQEKKR